jgi:hypothetical protein
VKRSTFVTVPSQPQPSRLRVEVDRTQFALGLLVLAERPVHGSLTTFIQLGASATRVSSSAQISGQPRVSDSAYAPMASAALGLGYRFAAGMPFVDIGGAFVGDAHLATDPGAKWPYFLEAGYRFDVR